MKNIAQKEVSLLTAIVDSEYQYSSEVIGNEVWLDYLVDSESRGGVLTSLLNKGFVSVHFVDRAKSDNYRFSGITDSTRASLSARCLFAAVSITEAGLTALKKAQKNNS